MTQTPEVPRSANQDFDILLDTVQKHVGDVYQTAVLEQGMGAIFRVEHNNVGKPYIDYCDPSHVLTEAVGSCQPVPDLSAASTAVAVKLRAELGLAGAAAVGFFGQAQRDNIDDFDKKCAYYFPGTGNATKYLAGRLLNVFANHHSEIDEKTAQGVAELYLLLGRHGWSDKQLITPEGVQTPLPDHDTYKTGLLRSLHAWAEKQSGLPGLQSALCELERNILGRDLVGYGRADGVSKRIKGGPSIGSSLRLPKLAAAALATGFGLTVAASPSAAAEATVFSPTNILPPQPGEMWSVTLPTQASATSVSQRGLGGTAVPFRPATTGDINVLQALKSVPIAEKLRPDEGADSPTQLVADNLGTTAVLGGGVKPPEQRRVPASSNSETTTAPVETPTAKSAFAQSIEQRMKQLEVAETAQTATPASAGKYRTLIEQILRNPTVVQNFSDPQKNQILTGENTPNSDIFVQMVGLKLAQLNNGTEPGANGYTSDAQQIITALLLRYELLVQPESDAMRQLVSQAQELAKQQQSLDGASQTDSQPNGGFSASSIERSNAEKSAEMSIQQALQEIIDKGGEFAGAAEALQYYAKKDARLTPVHLAGMAGNIMQESGGKFDKHQNGGSAIGVFQWDGGRKQALIAYANEREVDWTDKQTQLDYGWQEMSDGENSAYEAFIAAYDQSQTSSEQMIAGVETTTTAFSVKFERPGKPHLDKRIDYAQRFYAQLLELLKTDGAPVPADRPVSNLSVNADGSNNVEVVPEVSSLMDASDKISQLKEQYGNVSGKLSDNELRLLDSHYGEGHRLNPEAAVQFEKMSAAFEAEFGHPIAITDSYRDYAAQVDVKNRKPGLAATPGTSNHGWGFAVDLGDGIESFGTEEHTWLQENSWKYGWVHPGWAHPDGSKPEPWHWEYKGNGATPETSAY